MSRPRFTIATLLGTVLFLAVGLAALREATDGWDSGMFGSLLAVLMISVLLAIHRKEAQRAYWLGFSLFGWFYLTLSFLPGIESRLPTTKLLNRIDSLLGPRPWINTLAQSIDLSYPAWGKPTARTIDALPPGDISMSTKQGVVHLWDATTGSPITVRGGTSQNCVRIGHSILAMVSAHVGGCLSWRLSTSGRSRPDGVSDLPTTRAVRSEGN